MANHHVKTAPAAKLALIIGLALLALTVFILLNSLNNTIEKNTIKGDIDVQAVAENKAAITGVNLKPVGEVRESDGSGAAPSATRSGEDVYKAVCAACHATGAAGAPKVDDKAAWEPRIANGFDALLKTAIAGKGAMPARGGQNVPDDELTNAIAYMTKQAGFSLDIPKAAASAEKATATTEEKPAEAAPTEVTTTPEAKPAEAAPVEATTTPEAKPAEAAPVEATATPEAKPAEAAPVEATTTPEAKPAEAAPVEATTTPEAKPAEAAPVEATTTAKAKPTEAAPTEETATPEAKPAESAPAEPVAEDKPVAPAPEAKPAAPTAEKKAATTSAIDGKAIYKTVCFVCHDVGVANAPKLTDKAAWQPRIATGKDALYHSALNGKGAMPPKGGQMKLSDDEVKAVVDYMLSVVQ